MTDISPFGAPEAGVAPAAGLVVGEDGNARCFWGGSTPDYVPYHDNEWGRPVRGDDALFERMCLEAFQSGLSWITIRASVSRSGPRSPVSRSPRWRPSPTPTRPG